MNKWFKTHEYPLEIIDAIDRCGSKDYISPKTVCGGYGYLPKDFYNELVNFDGVNHTSALREFNYKVSPNEYRRGVVTKDYKPFYDLTTMYMVKFFLLKIYTYFLNKPIYLINKYRKYKALDHYKAMIILKNGGIVGNMTMIGGFRQWEYKLAEDRVIAKLHFEWKEINELPTYHKYKEINTNKHHAGEMKIHDTILHVEKVKKKKADSLARFRFVPIPSILYS